MDFSALQDCNYAVIGDPVAHSVSPVMQNAAFAKLGLGAPYGKIRIAADELPIFAEYARRNLKGFNITVPHKQAIIPFLDEIAPEAALAHSVNTVTVRSGKLFGTSTDGYGLATALHEAFGVDLPGLHVCFIGCGGAVQATAFYFAAAGAAQLCFINRTVSKAEALATEVTRHYPVKTFCCATDDDAAIADCFRSSKVIVQGSSLGLKPEDPCPIAPTLLTGKLCCYETIYKNTAFLRHAEENGLKTADGRTMLLHQGAKSFEIWTGVRPDIDAMRQALNQALNCIK